MPHPNSVRRFRAAIQDLPSDKPRVTPGKWYHTQKEHWLGWLAEYDGPGAYGRNSIIKRDARFAYNHIVEVKMLLWLATASGVSASLLRVAREGERNAKTLMAKAAAVRRVIPWEVVAGRLWGKP